MTYRCTLCKSNLEKPVLCPKCYATYHEDCYGEKCSVMGCEGRAARNFDGVAACVLLAASFMLGIFAHSSFGNYRYEIRENDRIIEKLQHMLRVSDVKLGIYEKPAEISGTETSDQGYGSEPTHEWESSADWGEIRLGTTESDGYDLGTNPHPFKGMVSCNVENKAGAQSYVDQIVLSFIKLVELQDSKVNSILDFYGIEVMNENYRRIFPPTVQMQKAIAPKSESE